MQTVYVSKGKELLKLLINNGFEGYFVGEVVRNTIMNIDFKRADIITNAKIDDLRRINNFMENNSGWFWVFLHRTFKIIMYKWGIIYEW